VGYSTFEGVFKAVDPVEGDQEYVTLRIFNDFILLEYNDCMDGSVYSFYAMEFWPDADGVAEGEEGEVIRVEGKAQHFSLMTRGSEYSAMPVDYQLMISEAGLEVTDTGVTRQYVLVDDFSGHSSFETQCEIYSQIYGAQQTDEQVVGQWSYWDGWHNILMQFEADGAFHMLWKEPGKPVDCRDGVWGVDESGTLLQCVSEKIGSGTMPMSLSFTYGFDAYGYLTLEEEYPDFLDAVDGYIDLWPEEDFSLMLTQSGALGYFFSRDELQGSYTDDYGDTYYYGFDLPQFLEDSGDMAQINAEIRELFAWRIDEARERLAAGEYLNTDYLGWNSSVVEGILSLYVYAYSYESTDEHVVWYYDLENACRVDAAELLRRMELDQDEFLSVIYDAAETCCEQAYSNLSAQEREDYGYDRILEWTLSEDQINLNVPVFVDDYGSICVCLRIGSLAGPDYFWATLYPFGEGSE